MILVLWGPGVWSYIYGRSLAALESKNKIEYLQVTITVVLTHFLGMLPAWLSVLLIPQMHNPYNIPCCKGDSSGFLTMYKVVLAHTCCILNHVWTKAKEDVNAEM